MPLPDPMPVTPIEGPLDVVVSLPGSKSITNRALVCAALADGTSTLTNALHADDTEAMVEGLRAMGAEIDADWAEGRLVVTRHRRSPDQRRGDRRRSPVGHDEPLPAPRRRPRRGAPAGRCRQPDARAPDGRGASTPCAPSAPRSTRSARPGHLPVEVIGGTLAGGEVAVRGDVSSQFLSGLLLAGPAMRTGLVARLVGDLVSEPYVDMTVAVMADLRRRGAATRRAHLGGGAADLPGRRPRRSSPTPARRRTCSRRRPLLGGRATVDRARARAPSRATSAFVDVLERDGRDGRARGDEHDRHRHRAAPRASRST